MPVPMNHNNCMRCWLTAIDPIILSARQKSSLVKHSILKIVVWPLAIQFKGKNVFSIYTKPTSKRRRTQGRHCFRPVVPSNIFPCEIWRCLLLSSLKKILATKEMLSWVATRFVYTFWQRACFAQYFKNNAISDSTRSTTACCFVVVCWFVVVLLFVFCRDVLPLHACSGVGPQRENPLIRVTHSYHKKLNHKELSLHVLLTRKPPIFWILGGWTKKIELSVQNLR